MRLPVKRSHLVTCPDIKRVITRFFFNGDERATDVINRVMALSEGAVRPHHLTSSPGIRPTTPERQPGVMPEF